MLSLSLASSLVAFFATAGAIPLCRNALRHFRPSATGIHDASAEPLIIGTAGPAETPRVAGAGIFLGVVVSLFYLDTEVGNASELFLAGVFLLLVGMWVEQQSDGKRSRYDLGWQLAGSLLAGAGLMFSLRAGEQGWTVISAAVACMALLTPAALSFLGRPASGAPALPMGLVAIQLALLLALGAVSLQEAASLDLSRDFRMIALPTIGALLGALIYLWRMPWRPQAAIQSDVPTRLCLGLVVTWGVLGHLFGPAMRGDQAAPLLWILALPIFESGRQWLSGAVALASTSNAGVSMQSPPTSARCYSTGALSILALMLGGVGLLMWLSKVPAVWSVTGLLVAFAFHVIAPMLISNRKN